MTHRSKETWGIERGLNAQTMAGKGALVSYVPEVLPVRVKESSPQAKS